MTTERVLMVHYTVTEHDFFAAFNCSLTLSEMELRPRLRLSREVDARHLASACAPSSRIPLLRTERCLRCVTLGRPSANAFAPKSLKRFLSSLRAVQLVLSCDKHCQLSM
jgi:hypothetical protein